MSTVRLKFLIKELTVVKFWNVWNRKNIFSTAVKRCLKDPSIKAVIQCFKYTVHRPRRTLLLAAAAQKFHDESKFKCESGISDNELQALLLELDNVQELAKVTLYCSTCGKKILFDRKLDGVHYCGCKEPVVPDKSEGWLPYLETADVIIWRKEYTKGKGLYAYKVYGRYPEVSASDYAAVHMDGGYRRSWDNAVAALAVVERNVRGVVGQTVLHWEVLWPRLFANRDYVYIRRHKEFELKASEQKRRTAGEETVQRHSASDADKVFVIISKSCEHPSVPETKHAIRVSEYWSNIVVRTTDGPDMPGVEFVLTYYEEAVPGGMPCGVAAWASSRVAPAYFARMRQAAREYRAWAASQDSQDLPDFIPLSPDQVNRGEDSSAPVEERDMETSKQGPEMENGSPTREQSTQTDPQQDNTKDSNNTSEDPVEEGPGVNESKRSKEETDVTRGEKKTAPPHEERRDADEDPLHGWWHYLHPF